MLVASYFISEFQFISGTTKLLGVPKLPAGIDEAMVKAVVDCLENWNIKDCIQPMLVDTTRRNTDINLELVNSSS